MQEDLQRKTIFHTRSIVENRVCWMIIDGGSYANMSSQTLVSKLSLLTSHRLNSYAIQWWNQSKDLVCHIACWFSLVWELWGGNLVLCSVDGCLSYFFWKDHSRLKKEFCMIFSRPRTLSIKWMNVLIPCPSSKLKSKQSHSSLMTPPFEP